MTGVLQPGEVAFDLDLAGSWARGTLRRLPEARSNQSRGGGPEHWDETSEAMSALLSNVEASRPPTPTV